LKHWVSVTDTAGAVSAVAAAPRRALRSTSESAVSLATSRSKSCASAPSVTDGWSAAVAEGVAIAASLKWIKSML